MFLNILSILLPLLLLIGFGIGIFFSFRLRFMPGALFFFILLVNKMLQFYFQDYITGLDEESISLPQDMSIGSFISAFQSFSNVIEIIAFIVLLFGLYKKWTAIKNNASVEELKPK